MQFKTDLEPRVVIFIIFFLVGKSLRHLLNQAVRGFVFYAASE